MTMSPPGFAVVSAAPGRCPPALAVAATAVVPEADCDGRRSGLQTATWGGASEPLVGGRTLVLTREVRRRNQPLGPGAVARMLAVGDRRALAQMLPTFGAALHTGDAVIATTDALGFRHLYYRVGDGWTAVSTSARVLARLAPTALDRDGLAVQSLLGWQLRGRSLFESVTKVPAGGLVEIRDGRIRLGTFTNEPEGERIPLAEAVASMSSMLRSYLSAYLDDHPDAVLQLTGGQDSRLLLSAIEPRRRRGLRVVTLGRPDSPDVVIASRLAHRYGMKHEILSVDGLDTLDPDEAYARCAAAAGAIELGADPLAWAALDFAEARAMPGPRISGLGGEVARGFYYLGRDGDGPVTESRARRLADWRMFVNEAVEAPALRQEFRERAREVAHAEVLAALSDGGRSWFEATDELYLGQRMQHWAGATESPVSARRRIVNPMLDDRWIANARALAPEDKAGSKFLARLQIELDAELAGLPLEGRPSPATYAAPGLRSSWRRGTTTVAKAGRKLGQRVRRRGRPPVGGEILTRAVTTYWRAHPETVAGLAASEILEPRWLDDVLTGRHEPGPSTVAFLLNLSLAADAMRGSGLTSAR
jgi:asparagine synthase (glutamine-hydrolysing)